jgi:hypothetical protein
MSYVFDFGNLLKCVGGVMWQPDGWGWRARIGVLTPHADIGPEAELRAMAPDGVSIHAARVPLGAYAPSGKMDQTLADDPIRAFAEPPLVDDAGPSIQKQTLKLRSYRDHDDENSSHIHPATN